MNKKIIGFLGKIPTHGDFVYRNVPEEYRDHWIKWLSGSLAISQDVLKEDWLDVFLTSPVWKFGILEDATISKNILGVMIPSVDRVGRYFPFITFLYLPSPFKVSFVDFTKWIYNLERLTLGVLSDGFKLEKYIDDLFELEAEVLENIISREENSENEFYSTYFESCSKNQDLVSPFMFINNRYIQKNNEMYWWTKGSDRVNPCAIHTFGYPNEKEYTRLISGKMELDSF